MSDSVRPRRWQPTRLPRPWDSPGKNTGVGGHFLSQCMKVKSESEVTQSSSTLHNPGDCSLPGSSVHGIFQARVLEWGAIDTHYSHINTLSPPSCAVSVLILALFVVTCLSFLPSIHSSCVLPQRLKKKVVNLVVLPK